MNNELTTAEKLEKLPWSIATNALTNFFLQLTLLGSVFILFLNALGFDKAQIGFLLSLLPYTGVLALIAAPLIARVGYKRTFAVSNIVRTVIAAGLIITPWLLATYGSAFTLTYVTLIVILFSIARSLLVTAYYPWVQEYVPKSIQGKYSASNNLFTTLAGFLAVTFAGFMLDLFTGLTGYIFLITIGLLAGLASIWTTTLIPGGTPIKASQSFGSALLGTVTALRDRGLLRFLAGLGLLTLATVPLTSFVPLFMQEVIGLSSGNVVLIQNGMMLGGLVSTYLWGWTADRYGSRPIMLSGIALYALLPVFWMLMPRDSQLGLYAALAISFLHGIADMGWIIGSTRLLYVSIVPPEQRSEYTALYYACLGLFGGTSQLLAGQIVLAFAGVSSQFYLLKFDAYSGLFVGSMALSMTSFLILRHVRSDTKITVEEFAGMFLHGNPLQAMTSLIGYHFARDESALVSVTERLGVTRSPLTVDELLEVLKDPRFNVRYEAIISIARTRQDPRLTRALIDVLQGTELALSNHAAWALGRLGDRSAIPALRQGLQSKYHSIRGNCARALGRLKAAEIIPLLRERLHSETDKGLQMAYASALGNLRATEAAPEMLQLLWQMQNQGARQELALSLARLVGSEGHFIGLLREARSDFGTTTSRALTAFKRKIRKDNALPADLLPTLEACADRLARDDLEQGAPLFIQLIGLLPPERYDPDYQYMLHECANRLAGDRATMRDEYLLLALHIIDIGWDSVG